MPKKLRRMARLVPLDRMRRVLGRPGSSPSPGVKTAVFLAALLLLTVLVARIDPRPRPRPLKGGHAVGQQQG